MVFEIICFAGLVFVVLALPGALRRRRGVKRVLRVKNDVTPSRPYWKNSTTTALARDRLEELEMWSKNNADPMNFPAPIAPSKPHHYFGYEAGADKVD